DRHETAVAMTMCPPGDRLADGQADQDGGNDPKEPDMSKRYYRSERDRRQEPGSRGGDVLLRCAQGTGVQRDPRTGGTFHPDRRLSHAGRADRLSARRAGHPGLTPRVVDTVPHRLS